MTSKINIILLLIGTVFTMGLMSCHSVPDYVIQPNEMADLMADIHIAESVVEANFSRYPTDSSKMLLKQSVLAKHKVSLDQLDTSLVWYGANPKVYNDVYEKTLTILSDKLEELGVMEKERQRDRFSDSIDVWSGSRFMLVKSISPSRYIKYNLKLPLSRKHGEIYTFRAKFANINESSLAGLTAYYEDGTFEELSSRFAGSGWHEITLFTDSSKTTTDIKGFLSIPKTKNSIIIDSIQLIKKPFDTNLYVQKYRQHKYYFFVPKNDDVLDADTLNLKINEPISSD